MIGRRALRAAWVVGFASFAPAAHAIEEWHIAVPTTFDFYGEERETADRHLDPDAASAGILVEYETELEGSRGELTVALDAYNRLAYSRINFDLAASGSAPWVEGDGAGELWGDPHLWGTGGPTIRVVVQSCGSTCDGLPAGDGGGFVPGAELGATGAIWLWDEARSTWAYPRLLQDPRRPASYGVLMLRRSNYPTPGASVPNDAKLPSSEVIAHEIGHALGFEEQRMRKTAYFSALESPTALPNVYRANSPAYRGGVFRLGAYAQGLLREYYPARLAPFANEDWVVHDAVLRRDPTQPLGQPDRVVALSIFQAPEIAPQHLIWNDTTGTYEACQSRTMPVFYAQVSEVGTRSSGCAGPVALEHVIVGTGETVITSEAIANPCDAGFNEYQFKTYAPFTDAEVAAAGYANPPTTSGSPLAIDVAIRVSGAGGSREWSRLDNEVRFSGATALVLFPSDTDDPRCVIERQGLPSGPVAGARLGRAMATNKRAPNADQYAVIGAPYLDVGAAAEVGAVVVAAYRGATSGGTAGETVAGFPIEVASPSQVGGERFGEAVAIGDSGNRFVVGAPGLDNDDGGVYVCDRSGATYSCGTLIRPAAAGVAGRFGAAVALSPNGRLLAVGEPEVGRGRVHVYTIEDVGGSFRPELGISPPVGARYGAALATNNQWLVIGDPARAGGGDAEARYVDWEGFDAGGSLLTSVVDLGALVTLSAGDEFGAAVSVHDQVLVVGAPGTGSNDGAAYVFGQPHGDMAAPDPAPDYNYVADWRLMQELPPIVTYPGARYGVSVDNYRADVIIGAPDYDSTAPPTPNDAGAAFLYRARLNEGWSVYDVVTGGYASDRLGRSVALGSMFWLVGEPLSNRNLLGGPIGTDVGHFRRGPYRTLSWYW